MFGNKNDFFHPTIEKDLQLLESFSASEVLQKQVGALKHFVMVQIEELTAEESAFRSGKKKQQITDWWLKLIENETNAFLTERGWKSVRSLARSGYSFTHI